MSGGANWVPTNCVYSEIRKDDYDFYIRRAVESNLSMLRIWGGGIYEPDYFFDLCDENGIMVFQDFMLACGIFPQDDVFLEQVSREVEAVVEPYYNRASWCFGLRTTSWIRRTGGTICRIISRKTVSTAWAWPKR